MKVRHLTREEIGSMISDEREEMVAKSHVLAKEAFGTSMGKDDVRGHVTEVDLLVVCSDKDELASFGSFHIFTIDEYVVMHLYGICVNPSLQGKGMFGVICDRAKSIVNPDVISSRTQSPRLYKAFKKSAGDNPVYPQCDLETPDEVKRVGQLINARIESSKNYDSEDMMFRGGYTNCLYKEIPFLVDGLSKNWGRIENEKINKLFQKKLAIEAGKSRDAIFLISFLRG